ncbi:MAG: CapA family protein [Prevotella sp.]|nr:CapA family protein [Prevotella sp.]
MSGIDTVGGGLSLNEASLILYKNVAGKKLAVINCCEHEFSIATESTAGSNPLNPIQQFYAIQTARQHADYVVVIVHGGHERFQLPSPRMQETYRFFIDAGADAVVNHHQHCYSGYEYYQGKPIFYGLGNFCFDTDMPCENSWYEGYIVELNFTNREKIEHRIIPYTQCMGNCKINILPESYYDRRISELNSILVPLLIFKCK